jgi:hypothetical protein
VRNMSYIAWRHSTNAIMIGNIIDRWTTKNKCSRNLSVRSTWVHPRDWCYSIFSFMCMFCRSLFILLSFFFGSLCCLSFDLRILITPLVSSNSSFLDLLLVHTFI